MTPSSSDLFGIDGDLNERNAYYSKVLPDGRVIDVLPLTFHRGRIVISRDVDARTYEDGY